MEAPRRRDPRRPRRRGAAIVAATPAVDEALTPRLAAAVEVVAFVALLVVAAAAWVHRPGSLLEVATIGVAGAALWIALRQTGASRSTAVLAGLSFAVCLTNTWPGRGWTLAIGHLPAGPDALLAPATVLLVLAVALDRHAHRHGRMPGSLRLAAVLLIAAVVVSTLIAHKAEPAGAALLEIIVPLAVGWLVIRRSPDVEDAWVMVTGLLAGVSVPALIGIAAYVLQLGFPTSAADLIDGKSTLAQTLLFQQVTYGNVDHFAVLAVLLLPAAVLGAVRPRALAVERGIAIVATLLLVAVLLLILSRLSLAAGIAELVVLAALLSWRRAPAPAASVAVLAGCLLLLLASPSIRSIYTGSSAGAAATTTSSVAVPTPAPEPAPSSLQRSATFREGAVQTGLRVFEHHAPFGVGTGQYPLYDPVHTAPHSLFVELLAENGVLGAGGLLAVAWYVLAAFLRVLRRPPGGDFELQLACLLGAGAFLGVAVVGGAALLNGYTDVWAVALAVLVGVSVRAYVERDVSSP